MMSDLDLIGTMGTEGLITPDADLIVLDAQLVIENTANNLLNIIPIDPAEDVPEDLIELEIKRPSFISHVDWFMLNGTRHKPGLYWHNEYINKKDEIIRTDEWISNPLSVEGITCTKEGSSFGRLLRFKDSNKKWHEWAMPMYLLSGSGEELRKELLDLTLRTAPCLIIKIH